MPHTVRGTSARLEGEPTETSCARSCCEVFLWMREGRTSSAAGSTPPLASVPREPHSHSQTIVAAEYVMRAFEVDTVDG
jgi:hypothetical protein